MTKARTLADMISDGVIGTTELADDVITPVKLDETGNYSMAELSVSGTIHVDAPLLYGRLEMGGPSGGYIDLSSPFSDDYDLRLIHHGNSGSPYNVLEAKSGDLYIASGPGALNRMKVSNSTGDITMFKDDGATPGVTFDASTGNVGIGASPEVKLDVEGDILINNNSYLYGENSVGSNSKLIGRASNDTLYVGDNTYANPTIIQTGNNFVSVETNGSERLRIEGNGDLKVKGSGSDRFGISYDGVQKVALQGLSAPGGNDTDVLSIQTYSNGNYHDRMKFTRNGAIIEQPGSPNSSGLNLFMRKQHFYGSSAFNNPTLDLVSGNINTAAYPQCMIYIKCYQMGVASNRALITEAMASIGGGSGSFYTTAIDGFSHVKNVNTSLGLGSLNVVTSGTAWTLQWTGNRVTNYDRYWLEVEVVHHQGMSDVAFAL